MEVGIPSSFRVIDTFDLEKRTCRVCVPLPPLVGEVFSSAVIVLSASGLHLYDIVEAQFQKRMLSFSFHLYSSDIFQA